jgi:hypothetical protein
VAKNLKAERLDDEADDRAAEAEGGLLSGPAPVGGDKEGDVGNIEPDLGQRQSGGGKGRRASPIDKTARTMASTRLPWTETTAP